MKFLVVCLLLLTCIVALSIQRSEGFFNTPARIAITACLEGDIVVFKAKTTDNTTISNVFLVNHSSKNSLEAGESTDTILVHNVTVTPTETSIGDASLSRMVIGKKYYVIQVAAATATNADAKKYKVPGANAANAANAALNTLMGVYTHSPPSPCNARIIVTSCMKGDQMVLNAKTTDNTNASNVYVVYHSSKNSLVAGESTDQVLVINATVTKTESTIHTFRPSNMVAGKKYYIIQVTAPNNSNATTYKVPIATPAATSAATPAAPNILMGIYTYSAPSPCPSDDEKNVDDYRSARSDDAPSSSSTRTSRSSRNSRSSRSNDTRYRSDAAPTAAHWRTFDRQDPSGAAISATSDQAKSLKQRMDILSDIQTLMKKKTLESRRVPYKKKACKKDGCECDGGCDEASSASLSQGCEYKRACDHDMSQYIRKDSIPCWKCNLDY